MKRSKEAPKEGKPAKKEGRVAKRGRFSTPTTAAGILTGPLRYVLRFLLIVGVAFVIDRYQRSLVKNSRVAVSEVNLLRKMNVTCGKGYEKFPKCTPSACGRVVMDRFASTKEVDGLLDIAKRGMAHGGGAGGATILDLHSGALSRGKEFVSIYKAVKETVFTKEDFDLYKTVKDRVKRTIGFEFKVPDDRLYLTHPTFFSRMNDQPPATSHDEYWHPHIDRITYPSFYYTSLLYLTTFGEDFTGGEFVFIDTNSNHTVEPSAGRLSFFTSGSENKHRVTRVEGGTRYAITISFTCDKKFAIQDPSG